MAIKITKREHFSKLLSLHEVQEHPELIDFINHELELLAKKNASEKKLTPSQRENEIFKAVILENLDEEKATTISDLIKNVPELHELSNQRVSAIMRQLKLAGLVNRVEEKHKAYFFKIPQE